ncbi:hypothetical protein E4T50_07290 [Aureobasidium sp. EXF-12298]|nr:hypothetical protein E4T50_07290 [Aureobasidium sp. EXF-12298]KAI4763862.1 hypothetical protein E4T51_03138 [Aureobasidium sp. EXF-12344]KAI4780887.1 hypothetical protein E4T52_04212 [Aureobasidium sp. EXF-3400]
MASSDRNPSMPLRKIDLSDSKYHSDGTPGFHEKMTREDNASFLKNLTEAFNKKSGLVTDLGYYVEFINEPPYGYASYIRTETHEDGQRVDKFIYGHSSGKSYASCTTFAVHVHAIIKGELESCACVNCQPADK